MMDKVQETNNSECDTPSSEPFRMTDLCFYAIFTVIFLGLVSIHASYFYVQHMLHSKGILVSTESHLIQTEGATCKFFSGYGNSEHGVSPELVFQLLCQ
jgi:hypothetical protein